MVSFNCSLAFKFKLNFLFSSQLFTTQKKKSSIKDFSSKSDQIFKGKFLVRIFLRSDWIRIPSKCGKIRTRKTLNMDDFHALPSFKINFITGLWDL